ncbi:MAG: hypothetical protein ACRYE7_00110 [Janthinobacterium lividum]
MDKCFNETINSIQKYIENKIIWFSIDEIDDCFVDNVIHGTLKISESGKSF